MGQFTSHKPPSRTAWKRTSGSAFQSASWSRPQISQCLLVKLGLRSHKLLMKLGLLGSQSTVLRLHPYSQFLLVLLGLFGLEMEDTLVAAVTAGAKPAGVTRPVGIATHSASTASALAVSSREAVSAPGEKDTTVVASTSATRTAGEVRPPGIAKHSASTFRTREVFLRTWGILARSKRHNQCRRHNSCKVCW